ncbi:RNA ligase [Mycobacterium phage Myrna]|uniref:RNA ligase n=1 Tax=Mycobacterium phage Myrna TaxID=546805 RepID=B5LJ98_9CAUD|nr:RNA ligase [Mycobacterium phage Myrna]ACH62095.1 RNA ligase [Mycobacterium phage Myrna]
MVERVGRCDPVGDRKRIEAMKIKDASAEQSKKTGGMVALYPRRQDLENLVIDDPKAEPIDDLHMTVIFLGEDVTGQDPTELISQLDYMAQNYQPIEAKVFAHAAFNPTGDEPCAVYLVGDNIDIVDFYQDMKKFVEDRYPGSKEQHPVYTPHITAGYGIPISKLQFTGEITLERIGLRWQGEEHDWDL